MRDDHVKRFKLSERQPNESFNRSADKNPPIKTKDNAQPIIPPPRTTFIPHPHLAPPGMAGSKLAKDAQQWMDRKRQERTPAERSPAKTFKPLVQSPIKTRGPER